MKKKAVTLIFIITLLGTNLFSQTSSEKINKQIKDPKMAENSAKADVYVQKKMINDTAFQNHKYKALSKRKKKRKKLS